MKIFYYLVLALIVLSCKTNSDTPEQQVDLVVAPAIYEELKGDYLLAGYRSNSDLFPVGGDRTEYIFRIVEDGSIAIFENNENVIIYSQIWDGLESDDISGKSITLSERIDDRTIRLDFSKSSDGELVTAIYKEVSENQEEFWAFFSSDISLRGKNAPKEFSDYEGSFSLWSPSTNDPESEGSYNFVISSDGKITYNLDNSDNKTVQKWNSEYGRIKYIDSETEYPKLVIVVNDPDTPPFETLELYFDLNTNSPYYARTYKFGLEYFGVNYYGVDINAGDWGSLTIAGDAIEVIGDIYSPSAPTFDPENDENSTKIVYTDIKLGDIDLKTTLFIEIAHERSLVFATLQTYPPVEGAEIVACMPDTCTINHDEVNRTITFVNATFADSIFSDILDLPKAMYNPILDGTLSY